MVDMRIGHGIDVHRFGPGDEIVIGGIRIPADRGVVAHSDGDVVLHALCDALLGAAALGDIGLHFPDNDQQYRNADSRLLLRSCLALISSAGWHVVNVDITLLAQYPRVAQYRVQMQETIASDLGVDHSRVSIKATTTEKLGYIGREEGLEAHAVVLLSR